MVNVIFSNTFLNNFSAQKATQKLGTLSGATLRISNMSNRGLSVTAIGEGAAAYYVEAYRFIVIPNGDYQFTLDTSTMMDYLHPSAQVAVTNITSALPYAEGSLLSATAPLEVMNVTGSVSADISNASIPITGNVSANISNASLPITGNVGITSGSVNATIQNASLNSNIINELVQTGVSSISTEQSFNITSLTPGTSQLLTLTVPPNIYDTFQIIAYSANGYLNYYNISLSQVRYQDSGMGGKATWYSPPSTLQFSFPYNADSPNTTSISAPISLNGFFFGNEIVVSVYNNGSGTISDVIKFVAVGKYATQSIHYSQPNLLYSANLNFPAEAIQASTNGVAQNTSSLQLTNAKKVLVFISSNGSGYTSGRYGIKMVVQSSYDNSNWFNTASNSTFPNNCSFETSGYATIVLDSIVTPQILNGAPYFRLQIYQYNNYTMSCNISNSQVGINIYAIY